MKPKYLHAAIVMLSLLVMGIQPALGTISIPSDTSIGTWDEANRIYTMTTDVLDGASVAIQIDEDNLTLDGAGHKVIPEGPAGSGIRLVGRTGITIKNVIVEGFACGIYLSNSSNNTLTGNTTSNNDYGIWLDNSSNNTLTDNTANSNNNVGITLSYCSDNTLTGNNTTSNNGYGIAMSHCSDNTLAGNTVKSNTLIGIWLLYDSSNNTLAGNTASNNHTGIRLDYSCNNNALTGNTADFGWAGIVVNESSNNTLTGNSTSDSGVGIYLTYSSNYNTVADNTANSNSSDGIRLHVNCSNNTLTGNTTSSNGNGISIYNSSDNTLSGNTANSNTYRGIALHLANNNTVTGNTVELNSHGIVVAQSSSSNTLTDNTASNNSWGINLGTSSSSTLTGNMVSYNEYGISLWASNDNQIYNNNFISNTTQASVGGSSGNIFNLDKPIGGNYWSDWTNPDADSDGFVDFPYVFNYGQDNLPWADPDGWVNQAPVANPGSSLTVEQTSAEGAEVQLDGSGSSDPDEDTLTYVWTWEGGSTSGVVPIVQLPPGVTMITLTVSDGKLSDTATFEVTVVDTIPPEISIVAPEVYGLYRVGELALDFSVTDATCEPLVLATLYSDGEETPVSAGFVPGAGVYTLGIGAWDDTGNPAYSDPIFFVVYDSEGGFVTGGGWIDSPEGAYKSDPSLTGKANFGLVSKYKKGTSIPTGNTEFVFQTADLNFHSSSYQWLVVNQAGTNAQFKGEGTINGEGDYKFMLWAGDGDPDTFRIKIWMDPDEDNTVYDNGFDQGIGGGNIIVHTSKNKDDDVCPGCGGNPCIPPCGGV